MIYFDQAAAVRPIPEILDFFRKTAERVFFNQEAAHTFAYSLRREMEDAGERMSLALTGKRNHVFWAAGGTEALQLCGMLPRFRRYKRCVSLLEHPAGGAAFPPVETAGEKNLRLYPHAESETGFLSPVPERQEGDIVLCDAIQSAGKLPLPDGPDLWVVSGHKLGGMGGGAILYRDETMTAEFTALRTGHRAGRPDPAAALTLAHAAEFYTAHQMEFQQKVRLIQSLLRTKLTGMPLPGGGRLRPTLAENETSPYILHLMLPGIQTGVLVRMLGERGVACSAGSACAAESDRPSPTLLAMNYSRQDAFSGLRLSFNSDNTPEEAEAFCRILENALKEY